ncbi:MAG: N-acetyltransferase [Acidimicrobiia bacterium]|nr:N-acetyltransferase [Acidimicrobiia bacterium]
MITCRAPFGGIEQYEVEGERLVLVHTGVPEELGGRGLGADLVRAALERATRDGLTIIPRCEFARGWLEKHPGAAAGVDVEWPTPPDGFR